MSAGSKEVEDSLVYFPKEFTPRSNDVIIGRGKKCYCHAGNQKLRRIVVSRLKEYSGASSQMVKSRVISSIIKELRSTSTNVAFVKLHPQSKRWFDIGDALAREKISQTFRDALHGNYKSSYKKKKKKAQQILGKPPTKRARSKIIDSHLNLAFTDTERNPNSAHLNIPDSAVGSTGSSNFVSSLMLILPPHLTEYENPFEPTPIFEAPSPIFKAPLASGDNNTITSRGENGRGGQRYNFSPTARTRAAKMA